MLRDIHHWASPLVMLPLGLVIATGVLLMLKKDLAWIQPPTQKSEMAGELPQRSFEELFAAAQSVPELELTEWRELDRVDVKPDKGIIKFVASNGWEAQIDGSTGEVLQVAQRRSDLIESLHDGSFFASWTKKWVFLPSGLVLLVLWGSGIYLFVLPHWKKAQKRRRAERKAQVPAE
nr:PepSY-associated TM helix domain-containing protein [Parvularcula mediterranea]